MRRVRMESRPTVRRVRMGIRPTIRRVHMGIRPVRRVHMGSRPTMRRVHMGSRPMMRRVHMGIRPTVRRADLLFAFLHRNQNAAFIICRSQSDLLDFQASNLSTAHAAGDDCSSRGLRPLDLSLVLQGWGNFYCCIPIFMCGWRKFYLRFILFSIHSATASADLPVSVTP